MANVITPTTAIAYLLNTGEVRDKTGFDDFHPNSTVNQVIIYVEDGDENNVMTINYNPEIIKKWASHWFPLFYRGLVEHTLDGESEPRTFAQYQSYMPTIVSALNINSTGPLEFNSTVRQQAGNNLIGSYPTVASLPTSYGDWDDLQDMEENNVVAYVYEAGVNGFYMVEFDGIYAWTLQTSGITNYVTAKPYNVIEGTILGGFNNPDEITELTDEQYRLIWQELSILSAAIVANDDDISDILDGTTPVGKAVADQNGNVIDLTYQLISNLVSAFQTTPDNTHYPSEKLVKDTIDAILNGTTEFTKIVTKELVILEIDDTPHSTTWDEEAKTLKTDLGGGVVLQHGQELHVEVKNDNGMAFYDFQLAMINTTDPSTGSNLNALLSDFAILGINPRALLGVITQEIAVANNGKNTTFGAVGGDTRDNATVPKYIISGGAVVRGDWVEGQILYAYTVAGSMIAVDYATLDADLAIALPKPLPRILIGVVERAGASGRIRIRPEFPVYARNIADFENGTYLTGEIFKYNAVTSLFEKFDLDAALLLKSDKTYVDAQLALKEDKANKGIANGYASLNASGKVPTSQLPAFVDIVITVPTYADLPSNLVFSNLNKTITNDGNFNFAALGLVDGSIITVAGTVSNNTNYTVVGIPTATVITISTSPVEETTTDLVNFTILAVQTYIGGSTNTIYEVTADETSGGNTSIYRWSGTSYIQISDLLSAEEIKELYESNPDTNEFNDAEKTKLGTVGTGANMAKSEFNINGETGLVDKALKLTNDKIGLNEGSVSIGSTGVVTEVNRSKLVTSDNGTTTSIISITGSAASLQNNGLLGTSSVGVGNNQASLNADGKRLIINADGIKFDNDLEVEGTITAEAIILVQPVPVASEVIVVPMTHNTNGDFYATVPGWILTLNHQIVALFPDTLTNLTENVRVSFDGIVGTYKDLKYDDTLNNVVVKHTKLLKSAVYYNGTEWFITGEPLVNQEFIFDEITNSIFGNAKAINGIPSLNNVYGLLLNQELTDGDDFATSWSVEASWTLTGGYAVYLFGSAQRLTQDFGSTLTGSVYVSFDVSDIVGSPTIQPYITNSLSGGYIAVTEGKMGFVGTAAGSELRIFGNGVVTDSFKLKNIKVIPIVNTPLSAKTATQLNAIIPTYFEGIKYITDFELQSVGLNNFDGEIELGGINDTTGEDVVSTTRFRAVNFTPVLASKDYILSLSAVATFITVHFYDSSQNFISSTAESTTDENQFTTTANTAYVRFKVGLTDLTTLVQLEEGTTATDYVAYNSPTTPFKITADLLSVGTVRDIAYPLNGNWWKDQYIDIDTTVVKAATTWTIGNVDTVTQQFKKDLSSILGYKFATSSDTPNILLKIGNDTFETNNGFENSALDIDLTVTIPSDGVLTIRVNKTTYPTTTEFEAYLQANDVTFIYELADIVTTEIEADGSLIQESNTTLIQGNSNFATEYKIGINFNDKAVLESLVDKVIIIQQELDEKLQITEEDLRFPATLIRVGVTTKPDFDTTEVVLLFPINDATEIAYINAQMPHAWKAGTVIEPHVHIIQDVDLQAVFKIDYRWHNIGDAVPASWTTYTMDTYVFTYVSGDLHQKIIGASGIDGTGKTESSVLQIKLYRDDNVYTGDCKVLEFDVHYLVEKFGKDIL